MYAHIHRGDYMQRGRGFGSIFSSLIRVLKPLFNKGASALIKGGTAALKDPTVKSAINDIKKTALDSGVSAIGKVLSKPPKLPPEARAFKRAKKRVATTASLQKKSVKKQKRSEGTIFDGK